MGDNENSAEPQQRKNKFSDETKNLFNLFGVVFPEPTFKPAFESVREGTTATIITAHTHGNNPFAFS